jgi:hypothetical protein
MISMTKTKSPQPKKTEVRNWKRRRDKVLYIAVTEAEHLEITRIAEKNGRTISDEVWKRLRSTLDSDDMWGKPAKVVGTHFLIQAGWVEHYDPRYGGTVLLPPGSAPPGPFMVEGKELPTAAASESVEKTLRGVFTAFDIPIEQRSTLRHAVLEALTKITGTLAASEAPDTASIAAEKMPKKEKKEEKQQKKKAEPRKQTTA